MRVLIALLMMCGVVQAEGLSLIGLCNPTWDCRATIEGLKGKPITVGWLENSFGNQCSCADRILHLTRRKTIRVHLINSPCLRNRRCDKHDAFYGYTVTTANRAMAHPRSALRKRFRKVLDRFKLRLEASQGELRCYVSPCLECDLNATSRNVMARRVRAVLPGCNLVDNPLRDACLPGAVCERHGADVPRDKPCIYDLDGTEVRSASELQFLADKTKHCKLRFAWSHWMNCAAEGKPFVMPRQRICNITKKKTETWGTLAWNFLSAQS